MRQRAVGWWQDLGWIRADPTAGLRHRPPDELAAPLSADQVGALFRLTASLREHAFWRLLHDSGTAAAVVLALDAGQLDLDAHQGPPDALPRHRRRAASGHRVGRTDRTVPALAAGWADVGDRVGGPAARVVPVTAAYAAPAAGLAAGAGHGHLFRPGPADRGYKNFVTNFARILAADPAAPRLTSADQPREHGSVGVPSGEPGAISVPVRAVGEVPVGLDVAGGRCRSSFICGHLAAGTPVGELLAITAICQAESLARYARHVDGAPAKAALRAWDKHRQG